MTNKMNLGTIALGAVTSGLFADAMMKILVTVIAMLVGTTIAHYWKKHLEYLEKNPGFFSRMRMRIKKWNDEFSRYDDMNNTDGV